MKIDALGFVEARGLIAAIVAADAMVKAANVKLIRQHQVDPRFITLVVEGDLAACRAAVDAGVAAASQVGEVVSRLEIGRPDGDTDRMVLDLIGRSKEDAPPAAPSSAAPAAAPKNAARTSSTRPAKTPVSAESARQKNSPTPATTSAVPVESKASASAPAKTARQIPSSQEILNFIAQNAKGRTWTELAKQFPQYGGLKKKLDEMLEKGNLRKTGNRYVALSA